MTLPKQRETELKANLRSGQVTNLILTPKPVDWHYGRGVWFYRAVHTEKGLHLSGKWVSFRNIVWC